VRQIPPFARGVKLPLLLLIRAAGSRSISGRLAERCRRLGGNFYSLRIPLPPREGSLVGMPRKGMKVSLGTGGCSRGYRSLNRSLSERCDNEASRDTLKKNFQVSNTHLPAVPILWIQVRGRCPENGWLKMENSGIQLSFCWHSTCSTPSLPRFYPSASVLDFSLSHAPAEILDIHRRCSR